MTPTPHDALFKRTFGDPEHAAGELRSILPPALVARLDFDGLRVESGSFVDEALSQRHAEAFVRYTLQVAAPAGGPEKLKTILIQAAGVRRSW